MEGSWTGGLQHGESKTPLRFFQTWQPRPTRLHAGKYELSFKLREAQGVLRRCRVSRPAELIPYTQSGIDYEASMIISGPKAQMMTPKMLIKRDVREYVEGVVKEWIRQGKVKDERTKKGKGIAKKKGKGEEPVSDSEPQGNIEGGGDPVASGDLEGGESVASFCIRVGIELGESEPDSEC
jgi:hypothetical protein